MRQEVSQSGRMANLEKHYHELLGLTECWTVKKVELELAKQRVEIDVELAGPRVVSCPECGEAVPQYDLREERTWRHLDVMQFETLLKCRVPRCNCPEHGVQTILTPWSGKHSRFTLLFEAFAVRVMQACDNLDAACALLGLNWSQGNEIRKRAVERGLAERENEPIEYVGIDEKSFGKGPDYGSILTDLVGKRVWDVKAGRKQESANELLETLTQEQRERILAIAMDMWPAFINAATEKVPMAQVVHDRFHVAEHLNEAVDLVRKQENRALLKEGGKTLVGAKYLFLKRTENLGEEALARFEELRDSKLKISRAWAIKDLFDDFWSFSFLDDAMACFKDWYRWATHCRLKPVIKVAKRLKKHWNGLEGYIFHPISNAAAEGFNTKIQNIKASAAVSATLITSDTPYSFTAANSISSQPA
jgi:transposase